MDEADSKKLREYLDREQIREAFNRYAFGVDSSDPEAVLSVFDDPCTLITQAPGKPPRRYEGRAAVERFFNKGLVNDLKLLRHRITDNLIKVDGDRADARLYWDEIREQNGQLILGGGIYFDKLRRVGDGWKFAERHAMSTYWITLVDKVDEEALATRILLAPRPQLVRLP
jgi:ketosteroid isomerase-like protein